jgi:hypothetical protein
MLTDMAQKWLELAEEADQPVMQQQQIQPKDDDKTPIGTSRTFMIRRTTRSARPGRGKKGHKAGVSKTPALSQQASIRTLPSAPAS